MRTWAEFPLCVKTVRDERNMAGGGMEMRSSGTRSMLTRKRKALGAAPSMREDQVESKRCDNSPSNNGNSKGISEHVDK